MTNAMHWERLSEHLKERSKDVCDLCSCTEDEHFCESYAYITSEADLLDVCSSDYFRGCSKPHAAVPLPWDGNGIELQNEVLGQCEDFEE